LKIQFQSNIFSLDSSKSLRIAWLILPVFVLSIVSGISSISASNGGEVSCYDRGIIDGEDHPFSQNTFDKCGDDYYQGFLEGCKSVNGNTENICESATDG
jgi:hypothetical protein